MSFPDGIGATQEKDRHPGPILMMKQPTLGKRMNPFTSYEKFMRDTKQAFKKPSL